MISHIFMLLDKYFPIAHLYILPNVLKFLSEFSTRNVEAITVYQMAKNPCYPVS